jgi:hypothetical protein
MQFLHPNSFSVSHVSVLISTLLSEVVNLYASIKTVLEMEI